MIPHRTRMPALRTRLARIGCLLVLAAASVAGAAEGGVPDLTLTVEQLPFASGRDVARLAIHGEAPLNCAPTIGRAWLEDADFSIELRSPTSGCDETRRVPFTLRVDPREILRCRVLAERRLDRVLKPAPGVAVPDLWQHVDRRFLWPTIVDRDAQEVVPEDRHLQGLVTNRSVAENATLAGIAGLIVAGAAVGAGVAGVFIETHQDPDRAPSDGPNMVPLNQLEELMRQIMAIDKLAKSFA